MTTKPRTTPIPRGYVWVATITFENDAYLVERFNGRKVIDYKAYGALRNAQAYITGHYGRTLWEVGNGVWYGHIAKARVPA